MFSSLSARQVEEKEARKEEQEQVEKEEQEQEEDQEASIEEDQEDQEASMFHPLSPVPDIAPSLPDLTSPPSLCSANAHAAGASAHAWSEKPLYHIVQIWNDGSLDRFVLITQQSWELLCKSGPGFSKAMNEMFDRLEHDTAYYRWSFKYNVSEANAFVDVVAAVTTGRKIETLWELRVATMLGGFLYSKGHEAKKQKVHAE